MILYLNNCDFYFKNLLKSLKDYFTLILLFHLIFTYHDITNRKLMVFTTTYLYSHTKLPLHTSKQVLDTTVWKLFK